MTAISLPNVLKAFGPPRHALVRRNLTGEKLSIEEGNVSPPMLRKPVMSMQVFIEGSEGDQYSLEFCYNPKFDGKYLLLNKSILLCNNTDTQLLLI